MEENVFPVFAAFGVLCALLPLTWHFRSKNYAVISLLTWIALWNFILFVNALVWLRSVDLRVLVWCDISGKVVQMASVAVPGATFCIARKLEAIASTRQVTTTGDQARRQLIFEMIICLGVPIIYGVLTIVYQGHRMDIFEGIGCVVPVYFSWPYIVLGLVPILVMSFASLGYSVLSMRWFLLRRRQFAAVLSSSGSNMNRGRYVRMMCFCAIDMVVTIPITLGVTIAILVETRGQLLPYPSWDFVHAGFSHVLQTTASELALYGGLGPRLDVGRWVAPVSAFLFFGILGLTREARAEYKRIGLMLWRMPGRKGNRPPVVVHVERSVMSDGEFSSQAISQDAKDIELQDKFCESPTQSQPVVYRTGS